MGSEWRSCTLGDLCDEGAAVLQTGPFGSQLHAYDYVEDGVPVVPTEAIRDRRVDGSVLPKITEEKARDLARHRLEAGDILFARRGVQATGHIGFVRDAEVGFLCGTGAIRLRIEQQARGISPEFLSHVLADPSSVEWFKFHAIGATMPNLNEGIIRLFPLRLPPISEQRAIAHILGTLDDKIELNRRMNETLEAIARALFKSWFVDFDPVRAKAEGRDPGLPKEIADLFPDSFEDSELGEIPKGWEVRQFSEAVTILRGVVNPAQRPEDEFQHFSIPAYDQGQEPALERGASIKSQKYRVLPGSVLLSKLNPEIERVWLPDVEQGDDAVCSTEFLVLEPTHPYGRAFIYGMSRSRPFRREIESLVTGTSKSHQRARPEAILAIPMAQPGERLFRTFEQATEPLLRRAALDRRESRSLAEARDGLLPRLVSGDLRLSPHHFTSLEPRSSSLP